ncbi:MAG TPA: sugar ABC transporter permease [Nitrospiraceae bacterium]|jgi:multiple sugar transport system permease protein|nr:sugar ABC transporter permease [Nitrospiraceae bacterium]
MARRSVRERATIPDSVWGYLCAAPAVLLLMALALGPILVAAGLSLQRRLPIFGLHKFVGFANYLRLIEDDRFWSACRVTLYFTAVSVAAELMLGLGIALLLDRIGTRFPWLQAIVVIPWAVPTVVSARLWDWLYQPDLGLINYLLLGAGLIQAPVNWVGDPGWAIHAAIAMDVWKATPFAALLLLAGLKAIPPDLYRAASVDGAGAWAIFRRITLPLLSPMILIVLVFRSLDAFRIFDAIYVLTGGGPGNSTETLSIYAYKTLFQTLQFGYGSALACAMFALMLIVIGGYLFLLRQRLREAG